MEVESASADNDSERWLLLGLAGKHEKGDETMLPREEAESERQRDASQCMTR